MRNGKRKILISILICLPAIVAIGREGKPLRLRGQVINSEAGPISGAEVVAYEKCLTATVSSS
ncbi:MAG: hypothetical protein ACYS6K_02255 [Planctomycetota bacterium]|jgi:hypothetical protein